MTSEFNRIKLNFQSFADELRVCPNVKFIEEIQSSFSSQENLRELSEVQQKQEEKRRSSRSQRKENCERERG